jgi:hypothetical protein
MIIKLHHLQLHSGLRFKALMNEKITPSVCRQLDFSKPNHPAVLSRSNKTMVSLLKLYIHLWIIEDTNAYFGTKLFEIEPGLLDRFMDWKQNK